MSIAKKSQMQIKKTEKTKFNNISKHPFDTIVMITVVTMGVSVTLGL